MTGTAPNFPTGTTILNQWTEAGSWGLTSRS
jgi:hypothetical protein